MNAGNIMSVLAVTFLSLLSFLSRSCIQAQAQQVFVVGGLGTKGESTFFQEWAPTFERYLTETVGQQFNITFALKYLSYDLHFDQTDFGEIDLIFTSPTLFACVERKYKASALLTLLNLRKGYELDRFYGVFITRNNSTIYNLTGIVDNVVEATSPNGLGACQLQWNELMLRGMDFLNQPKQVIFSYNQKQIVWDVLSGVADIGFVRTDLVETMEAAGEIDMADLRVIEDISAEVHPEFPFPFSTHTAAPEWPLAAFPWTDRHIAKAVSEALVSLNKTHYAAVAGSYSTFIPPVSYFDIHELQERLGFVREDGQCVSTGSYLASQSLYDSITCPEGQVKKHRLLVEHGCDLMEFPCPESDDEKTYDCLCRPCLEVPLRELDMHPVRRISPRHGEIVAVEGEETYIDCQKMEVCMIAEQRDLVQFEVVDKWFQFRKDLGEPFLHSVYYRFGIDSWQQAEVTELTYANLIFDGHGQIVSTFGELHKDHAHSPDHEPQHEYTDDSESYPNDDQHLYSHTHGRVFTFNVTANQKGLGIVEIRFCKYLHNVKHDGSFEYVEGVQCEHFDNSPILLEVLEATCSYPNQEPDEDGFCFCKEGYVEGGICEPLTPRPWYTSVFGIVALCLLGLILLLIIVGAVLRFSNKRSESWLIDRKAIQYSDPVEVLGRGTFGMVVLGNYRNTEVAVKRVLPVISKSKSKKATSSKSGSGNHEKCQFDFPDSKVGKASRIDISIDAIAPRSPDQNTNSFSALFSLSPLIDRIRHQSIDLGKTLKDRDSAFDRTSSLRPRRVTETDTPTIPMFSRTLLSSFRKSRSSNSKSDQAPANESINNVESLQYQRSRQNSFSVEIPQVSSSDEVWISIPTMLSTGRNRDEVDEIGDNEVDDQNGVDHNGDHDIDTNNDDIVNGDGSDNHQYHRHRSAGAIPDFPHRKSSLTLGFDESEMNAGGSSTSLFRPSDQANSGANDGAHTSDEHSIDTNSNIKRNTNTTNSSNFTLVTTNDDEACNSTEINNVHGSNHTRNTDKSDTTDNRSTNETDKVNNRVDTNDIGDIMADDNGDRMDSISTAGGVGGGVGDKMLVEVSSKESITDCADTLDEMESKQLRRILTKISSVSARRLQRMPTQQVYKRPRRLSIERIWFKTPSKAKANDMQFVSPSERNISPSGMATWNPMQMKKGIFPRLFRRAGSLHKQMNHNFLEEMKTLVYLRHPRIVTVMGAVVDGKGEPLLVMERMKNGSLYDLIHNNTMQFDGELVMRLLSDIVSGMIFLHASEPPILHNDLKAGNVLVDDSFHTKIADFGLSAKRKSSGLLGTPYWMAPELLHGDPPSKSSDVYAFGVLLFELFTRTEPYTDRIHFSLEQILVEVADISRTEAFRPTLPDKLPGLVKDLVCACWSPNPALRPSFGMIQLALESFSLKEVDDWMCHHCVPRLSSGNRRKGSIDSVNSSDGERDSHPVARSSTMLLHDVFPPHIARTLKAGKKVDPEHHNCVTIFFSDIVGFTDISSALPPLKVMKMLDTLYEKFDVLARKHDVFKVETIGDAYMAVANLIKEQPQHTRNIAEFSIDAIRVANSSLVCEEQPELGFVNIRVGFHSGPVVSSVVGNMNPRFCLFGDTVNTSSRMESASMKNRIHLSDTAAALLREHAPELELLPRGSIQVKGKGKMTTFWLKVPGVESEVREQLLLSDIRTSQDQEVRN